MGIARLIVILSFLCGNTMLSMDRVEEEAFVVETWPGYTRGPAFDIALKENAAFVAAGSGGVFVIDVSDPSTPIRATSIPTTGWVEQIALDDNILVSAQHGGPLQVYDVLDQTKPRLLAEIVIEDFIQPTDIAFTNGYAFVLKGGLQVVDLTDPAMPKQRGFLEVTNALSLIIDGDIAYILSHGFGFVVADISNPDLPRKVGEYQNNSWDVSMTLFRDCIIISGAPETIGDIEFVDISDPHSPKLSTIYDPPGDQPRLHASTPVNAQGLVVFSHRGLELFDLSNPGAPVPIGKTEIPSIRGSVTTDGNYAYVSDYQAGFHIFDIRQPSAPVHIAEFALTGSSFESLFLRNYAFVTDGMEGLQIFDLAQTSFAPVARVRNPASDYTRGLAVRENLAFVADGSAGFKILDIADPSKPSIVSTVQFIPFRPPGLRQIFASHLGLIEDEIVVSNSGNFHVFDISNPETPLFVSRQSHSNTVTDLAIVGKVAYFSTAKGMRVIDLSTPEKPAFITNFVTTSGSYQLVADSDYVYLPAARDGLLVFDATDPKNPRHIFTYVSTNLSFGYVGVHGNLGFITDRFLPVLEILDIQNVTNIVRIARKEIPFRAGSISVFGNRAFLPCFENGLLVLDLSDLLGPFLTLNRGTSAPKLEITGRPGRDYILEYSDSLDAKSQWLPFASGTLETPRHSISDFLPSTNQFFRASWNNP